VNDLEFEHKVNGEIYKISSRKLREKINSIVDARKPENIRQLEKEKSDLEAREAQEKRRNRNAKTSSLITEIGNKRQAIENINDIDPIIAVFFLNGIHKEFPGGSLNLQTYVKKD
jgi:hypothetical protein